MKKLNLTSVFLISPNDVKLFLPAFLLLLLSFTHATAQTITVSTTTDENNGTTTNIASLIATPGGAGISLREAVRAANGEPVGATITINLPAGNYILTLTGSGENAAATGDLDVTSTATAGTKTINFTGAGSGSTTITGSGDRILDLEPSNQPGDITVNISGITFTGGNLPSASGGAILAGFPNDVLNISNCAFTSNTSVANGGAISQSSAGSFHTLTITNTTFTNNTGTSGGGGAVNYSGVGNVTITGCTFSGNTAGNQGGALNVSGTGTGPVTTNILRNNFLNNRANGTQYGGAVLASTNAQIINLNFNRFFGNTSPNLITVATPPNNGDGRLITAAGGNATFNVDNNWWGVNTGPVTTSSAASLFGTSTTRWLQFKNTASPTSICTSSTSTITAGFLSNNLNEAIIAANLTAFVGLPITFNAPVNGTLSSAQASIQASGTATVTFTATTTGSGTANAVFVPLVENVTVTSSPNITIIAGASITSNPSVSTACAGLPVSFSGSASNQTSVAWQESTNAGFTSPVTLTNTGIYSNTTTTTLNISDNSGVGGRYYRLVAINSNGCPNANSTGALLTATAPTLPGTTMATNTIGTNNNLSYAASCGIVSKVVPSPGTPVSGLVTSNVWVESTVPTYGGTPFVQRHYQVTPAAGSTAAVTLYFSQTEFDNFNLAPGSSLKLPINAADAIGKANLRVVKFNGSSSGGGLPASYSSGSSLIDPADANIVWNAAYSRWEVTFDVAGFSGFIVQTEPSVLPIKLISFGAQRINNDIKLNWQATAALQNDRFEIQRSTDGRNFIAAGHLAANNGNLNYDYFLTDAGAATLPVSKLFYRLKMTGQSGGASYSNIVVVPLSKKGLFVTSISPNPFTDQLNVNLNMPKTGQLTLKLVDMTGRVLRKENAPSVKGFSTHTLLGMDKIVAGTYLLSVDFEGETHTYKVVKQ